MATRGKRTKNSSDPGLAKSYTHKDQTALMRPDVGTQAQFKKRKEPVRYSADHPIPFLHAVSGTRPLDDGSTMSPGSR